MVNILPGEKKQGMQNPSEAGEWVCEARKELRFRLHG